MPEQTFSQDAQEAFYSQLHAIAKPHVERSNGQLSILENDFEDYPAQALGEFCIKGQLQPPATTDLIGRQAMPRFIEMSYGLMDSQEGLPSLHQEAEELLREKQSIVVSTDHDEVTSPAYALGGFTNALRKANAYRSVEDKLPFESGIIVSKMLSILAYEFKGQAIPCMQVLTAMCDRVYLTYPRTKTFLGAGLEEILPPNHTAEHNAAAKTSIEEWMAQGAVVLGESLLGSTHRPKENGSVHQLPRVTKGSGEMVTHDYVHLLPVIVGLTEDDRYMQRVGPFQQFETWEDAHTLSEQMAAARTERNRARGSQVICLYQTAEQAEEEKQRLQTR